MGPNLVTPVRQVSQDERTVLSGDDNSGRSWVVRSMRKSLGWIRDIMSKFRQAGQ